MTLYCELTRLSFILSNKGSYWNYQKAEVIGLFGSHFVLISVVMLILSRLKLHCDCYLKSDYVMHHFDPTPYKVIH